MEQMARKFKPDGYSYAYAPPGESISVYDSQFMKVSKSIAQDVDYVNLAESSDRSARTDNEGCSGHECFFRRTGVRCSRCKI